MFENMNLDIMNEKEMEDFINGISEIINLPEKILPREGALILSRLWKTYRKEFLYLDKYHCNCLGYKFDYFLNKKW